MSGRRFERRLWARTGWLASADGGRVIEYSLFLPATMSTNPTRVARSRPGKPWKFIVGERNWSRPFRSLTRAMESCERVVADELRASLRALRR